MTPFGAKVRRLRKSQGLTLTKMAEALGVSGAYLSALEHGHRGRPNWSMVQRIITYFNVIWDEAEELERLARISDPRVTVNTAGMHPRATELANELAHSIGALEEDDLDFLLRTLKSASREREKAGVH